MAIGSMGEGSEGDGPEAAAARLAHAPIVLTGSRRKIGWIAAASLGFIAVGVWELGQRGTWLGVPVAVAGGMGLVLGLLGAAVASLQLIRPPTLTLTPASLTIRTLNRSTDLRWSEIERFEAWTPPSAWAAMVGYRRRGPPRTGAESLARALGCDGAIPDQFPLSTPALLALCEACRRRWG